MILGGVEGLFKGFLGSNRAITCENPFKTKFPVKSFFAKQCEISIGDVKHAQLYTNSLRRETDHHIIMMNFALIWLASTFLTRLFYFLKEIEHTGLSSSIYGVFEE